jgi:hypothetical protein
MTIRISDLHIALEEALPPPSELHAALPVDDAEAAHIARSRHGAASSRVATIGCS